MEKRHLMWVHGSFKVIEFVVSGHIYIRLFVSWTVENRRTDRNTIYKSPTVFHHIHVKPTA